MPHIETKEQLIAFLQASNTVDYLLFWGHQPSKALVSRSCLSQWYMASFEVDQVTYCSAEQYMMSEKAKLFGDEDIRQKILTTTHPKESKKLGRQIRGFDEATWIKHRLNIVIKANVEKFSQSPELKSFLLNTGECILVEASPYDAIWGIELAAAHRHCKQPEKWLGLNLLGFALMETRNILLREQ